jgi:hypothetical protein
MKPNKSSPPPLQPGQLWKTNKDHVEITQVGKLLAHYRLTVGDQKRCHNTMERVCVIQDYLKKNGGKLVENHRVAKTRD